MPQLMAEVLSTLAYCEGRSGLALLALGGDATFVDGNIFLFVFAGSGGVSLTLKSGGAVEGKVYSVDPVSQSIILVV